MIITLSENAILDSIYAHSALRTYMADTQGNYVGGMLTPAQAQALRSLIAEAAAAAAAYLGSEWGVAGKLKLSAPATLLFDADTSAALLQVAVSELTAYILLAVASDDSYELRRRGAYAILDRLREQCYSATTIAGYGSAC